MIESKDDYYFYLEADRIALGITRKRPILFQDDVWKFQRLLRKVEFLENCSNDFSSKIARLQARFSLEKLSVKLGFTIPRNVFGPGLSIAHRGTIVVLPEAKIGENCRINQGVTIGGGLLKVPSIGNNVFIGPGAVIWGDIEIADGIAIGANSYVAKSFKDPNITIAGCPAKQISDRGSEHLWIRATEILRHQTK
jgi:serine O-acetyltransferase